MLKKLVLVFVVLISIVTAANEPPAEGGEGGEGGEKAKAEKPGPKKKDELQDTRIEVDKRTNKVKALKEEIKKMMEEKNALPKTDVKGHSDIMKLIEEKYKEYRVEYEELQKAKTRLRFRFPDKGDKKPGAEGGEKEEVSEHKPEGHDPLKIESLESMEQESGIDAELTKSINLMRSKYKSAAPKKDKKKKKKKLHELDEEDSTEIITIQK